MGRNKRKNKQSPIFIIIIIFCFIALILLSFFEYNTLNKQFAKNEKLKISLKKVQDKHSTETAKEEELNKTLEGLSNVEETLAKAKEETFALASQLENQIINHKANAKIAYITFDDGPYHSTDKVLQILKEKHVKATFFTIGLDKDVCFDNKSYSCAETYKKIVDNGHTIANHTYSHLIFRGLYSSANSFITQVKKQEELIQTRTGVKTNIIRFPGGSGTARSLCSYDYNNILKGLKENGYGWVDWTAQDGDGGSLTSYETGWKNLTGTINEDIEVILFHDYNNVTISLLPNAIDYLEKNNYIILPLFYDSVKVNK